MSAAPKDPPPPPPPSSSSPPPPPPPPSSRRPPPPCWTHEETLALIESYIDKWNSLSRSHLSLADWQSVADTVADRCSGPPAKKKTLIQCKHKMEKLRRRYRSEKEKRPTSSSWLYFRLMDSMGIVVPSPSPAAAAAAVPAQTPNSSSSDDDDDRQPRASPPPSQRRSGSGLGELAAAMRMVTGGYVRMERTKMEAVREMEERRLEMEMERTRLVLEAQRGMMESVIVAFSGGGGGGGGGRKRKKFEGGTRSPMQL